MARHRDDRKPRRAEFRSEKRGGKSAFRAGFVSGFCSPFLILTRVLARPPMRGVVLEDAVGDVAGAFSDVLTEEGEQRVRASKDV